MPCSKLSPLPKSPPCPPHRAPSSSPNLWPAPQHPHSPGAQPETRAARDTGKGVGPRLPSPPQTSTHPACSHRAHPAPASLLGCVGAEQGPPGSSATGGLVGTGHYLQPPLGSTLAGPSTPCQAHQCRGGGRGEKMGRGGGWGAGVPARLRYVHPPCPLTHTLGTQPKALKGPGRRRRGGRKHPRPPLLLQHRRPPCCCPQQVIAHMQGAKVKQALSQGSSPAPPAGQQPAQPVSVRPAAAARLAGVGRGRVYLGWPWAAQHRGGSRC